MTQVSEATERSARAPSATSRARSRRRGLGVLALLAVVVLAATMPLWGLESYTLSVAYTVVFYAAVAQAWNLMSGFTGYISFAHGALVGIGSYAGVLAMNAGSGLVVAILAGAVTAVVSSLLIGLPSLRLHGIAFAFATIFFQAALLIAVQKAVPLTGGSQGLTAKDIVPLETLFIAMVVVAGTATLLVHLLRRSRLGLRLLSIREDETAARTIGIGTVRLKLGAFALSAMFAGAAGAVHAFFLATIFPQNVFTLQSSVEPLVLTLIGGTASAIGPVVMAAIYGISQEVLQQLGSELHLAMLGVVLVLAVLFARNGLAGLVTTWRDRRRKGRADD
ncbi:MAG TPA: branched-chain amino acid ABC transporter permease [Actinophytocola sp.]|nr:branched-chain amino acid ABC transporter permease [Actinophytocola sp.]